MRTGRPYRAVSSVEEEEAPGGMERWLLTYSDMITLLLALFVVLYALSSLNTVKYAQFAKGMDVSFNNGTSQPSSARTKPSSKRGSLQVANEASMSVLAIQLRDALSAAGLIKDVELTEGSAGLVVGLVTGKTYYGVDSAALSAVGAKIVDVTGGVIRRYANPVNVEGYTDNEPITGGPFRDNWQLSAERAVVVVERLQDQDHVSPKQLYIVGFGQYHPIVPNTSKANQAENRRVNIVITFPGSKAVVP